MNIEIDQIDIESLDAAERRQLHDLLTARQKLRDENKLANYRPYKKQMLFHAAGASKNVRERLLVAGNQLGKTYSAAMECAMHMTGRYPDWWTGTCFDAPVQAWAASLTSQGTRDTVQRLLLGQPGEWGTGAIPKDCIIDIKRAAHGVADAVETIIVRHKGGGNSSITLKTYDQGRERWQGQTLDFVWFDEEPPADLYYEGLTRTNATNGIVWMTFTPLLGMSLIVKRFLIDKAPGTSVTTMTIEDAEHYTPEQRAAIIAAYPVHEREARANGVPTMGSGRVFPVAEEAIRVEPFRLPYYWPRICGIDFGWDHPFSAVWLALDPDTDTLYVYDVFKVREQTPAMHASVMRAKGLWIPISWPHDGLQHDKGSGDELQSLYKSQGLNMLPEKASWKDGGNSVEKGIIDLLERMQTGRFKVFSHLNDWFDEFRLYHRKDGKLVKENDDAISATRYALMMLRFAKIEQAYEHSETFSGLGTLDPVAGW